MEQCPPNLPADDPRSKAAEAHERLWLQQRGLAAIYIPFAGDTPLQTIVDQFKAVAKGAAVILGCSAGGGNHSVVLYDGQIYNPAFFDVDGPMQDGMWWVTIYTISTQPLHIAQSSASVATQEEQTDGT